MRWIITAGAMLMLSVPALANDLPYTSEPEIPAWAPLYETLADCQPTPTTESAAKVCLKAVSQFYAAWLYTPPEIREECIAKTEKTGDVLEALGQAKSNTLWACITTADKASFRNRTP